MKKILYSSLLCFMLLFSIFFYKQVFFGGAWYCCDNLLMTIPAKLYFVESLKHGVFPLWNPYILSGVPFLADISIAALHPLNVLYVLFSPLRALTLSTLITLLAGGLGMFLFARSLKLSQRASFAASIIFTFSGTMIVYTNNHSLLSVATLTPLALWAWAKLYTSSSPLRLTILVGILSFQIFAGHPQLTYYSWIVYVFFLLIYPAERKFILLFKVIALVVLTSAIQWLPFLELARQSTRSSFGFSYATFGSLQPFNLVRLVLPSIVGNAQEGTSWAQGGSVYGYVGIVGILLAWFAPRKENLVRFFGTIALLSLILALGKYTPLYYVAYRLVPGLGSFREPEHFLFVYTLAVALLAGFGLDALLKRNLSVTFTAFGIFFTCLASAFGSIFLLVPPHSIFSIIPPALSHRAFTKFTTIDPAILTRIIHDVGLNFLFVAFVLCLFLIFTRMKKFSAGVRSIVLVFLIFLELFIYSRRNLFTTPEFPLGQEKIFFLNSQSERILVSPDVFPYPQAQHFGKGQLREESMWQMAIMRPNLNMLYHFSSPDGYAALVWQPYQQWLGTPLTDPTGVNFRGVPEDKLDTLGVASVLNKGRAVERRTSSPSKFYLVVGGTHQSSGIRVDASSPNEVALTVESPNSARLVYADTNYPGWKASLDGKIVILEPYEKIFKSVQVPGGVHRVDFRFEPESVRVGGILSLVGIFLLFTQLWMGQKKKEHKKKIKRA